MPFKLSIRVDNGAFENRNQEVAPILRDTADVVGRAAFSGREPST